MFEIKQVTVDDAEENKYRQVLEADSFRPCSPEVGNCSPCVPNNPED